MPINSVGLIQSDAPQNSAANPWETHSFKHNTRFTDPQFFCTHVSWIIYGDIPKNISIDSGSGVISGTMCHFGKQPSCQDNKPKDILNYNGSNADNNGRFKNMFYDFHFTIQRNTLISGPNPSTGAMDCAVKVPFVETSNVYIKMVKNHNIDNQIFMEQYIDKGKSGVFTDENGEEAIIETSININGKEYFDFKQAIKDHPGPFKDFNC